MITFFTFLNFKYAQAQLMKTILLFFVSILLVTSGFAQYEQRQNIQYAQTVTITFDNNGYGNGAYQVVMDGKSYSANTSNNNGSWNRNSGNNYNNDIVLNNIQVGQHSIQVYRLRNNNYSSNNMSPLYSSYFTLRQGFDAMLLIKRNGQVEFTERQSDNYQNGNYNNGRRNHSHRDSDRDEEDRRNNGYNNGGYNNGYPATQYRTAMAGYQFSPILQNVRGKWFQPSKVTAVRDAFNNTGSFFSSYQITQLLQLISSESNRLELAKLSYRVVADPANFTQVYNLFSNQNNRNELDRYVRGNRF